MIRLLNHRSRFITTLRQGVLMPGTQVHRLVQRCGQGVCLGGCASGRRVRMLRDWHVLLS
jgi:hypothetical protein